MIVVPTIDSGSDVEMIDSSADAKREKIWKNISSSSKATTKMEYPLFDFKDHFSDINDFDFMDNGNDIMVNEAAINFSKGIEDIGSASGSNNNQPVIDEPNSNQILPASANELHESPSTPQPSQMPKTLVDVGVELPPPLVTTNEQTQLDPMNANLNTFGEVPLDQLIASPDLLNESFLHGWSSDSNLKQPISLGFEGNNPSLQNDDDACQTTSPPFSPLIMERTNSFPLPLEEMLLKDGVYTTQPVYSECRVNSIETNQFNRHIGSSLPEDGVYTAKPVYLECRVNSLQKNTLNGHVGSSLQHELLSPQREDLINPSKRVTFADQFPQNNGNNNSNGNHQPLVYLNSTPQSLTGVRLLHGRSTQVNRQAPAWNSYKANDFYRPLASSGSQANEFQSIGNSDSQHYNFIQPRSSTLLRSQHQLKNSSQLLNQVPNRPNTSDSLLQHSMLTKHSMPFQLMSQNLSYQQHDQVSMAPGAYNPRTYSTRLTESSMPLRTSTLAPNRQTNPLDVSDLRYRNSLQPRSSMLSNSSGKYNFQDLNDYRDHQSDQFNLMTTQLGSQVSNSMLQDSPMHSGLLFACF
ncbi:hypothetical protein Godav_024153 [Gossypium davidsonii]|uniref:Uncharacterized protein n=1 Tax=Gossypium davidsonii TaxID=34287 RepID=A0A7J8SVP6_GOSDV|nr:hypothetical protein [Gossypium davidsonii]